MAKQFKCEVFFDNTVAFSTVGDYFEAPKAAKEYISRNMTASFMLSAGNRTASSNKSAKGVTEILDIVKTRTIDLLWASTGFDWNTTMGDKGKSPTPLCGFTVAWECVSNRRRTRPKHVIAAEKAAQAVKRAAKVARDAKYQAEADQRTVNLRKRIQTQVDHAFATGKSGTEPVSKYITCQHCDGPAAVVCLNQPIPSGASVLDEDTIVGALCAAHIQNSPWSYYSRHTSKDVHKIPCAKLEFFYDGIRQIAIKPDEKPAPSAMPTPEQLMAYRKKIGPITEQLSPQAGMGKTQMMRTFITKMAGGTEPKDMTTKQWDEIFKWMESFSAQHGMSKLIQNIEALAV